MKKKIIIIIGILISILLCSYLFFNREKEIIIKVPDFSKKTYETANKWCKKNTVKCEIKKEYSDVKYGKLISQSIHAGKILKDDDKLTIVYSDGHEATEHQKEIMEVAKKYSNRLYLSKQLLYNELINLKYSEEDSEYVVNHLDIDYKENALKRAKEYQKLGIEEVRIKENLMSSLEGFTEEEANYAIKNLK